MDGAAIAKVAFTSEDRVRDMIRNFNCPRFSSLYPKYEGDHSPKFTLSPRREIKKIARVRPGEYGLPFSAWSLSNLAEFLVAEEVVDDINHEDMRVPLREEGVTSQHLKYRQVSCTGGRARARRSAAFAAHSSPLLDRHAVTARPWIDRFNDEGWPVGPGAGGPGWTGAS
jgi:hypothetical protein